MEEEGWLSTGVAATLAKEYGAHQVQFLESLARLLESALPEQVEVTRRGGLFAREKPVAQLRVDLGEARYTLENTGKGPLKAQRSLVKRGIVLRSEPMSVEDWIAEVGAALDALARDNEAAAAAMRRFSGG